MGDGEQEEGEGETMFRIVIASDYGIVCAVVVNLLIVYVWEMESRERERVLVGGKIKSTK